MHHRAARPGDLGRVNSSGQTGLRDQIEGDIAVEAVRPSNIDPRIPLLASIDREGGRSGREAERGDNELGSSTLGKSRPVRRRPGTSNGYSVTAHRALA